MTENHTSRACWSRSWISIGVLLLMIGSQGCAQEEDSSLADVSQGHDIPGSQVGASGDEELSIYDLEVTFVNQDQETVVLSDLSGSPFVGAMFYTNCKSVCPRITADIQQIKRSLAPDASEDVQFVLFSLDPERDSPEAMQEFMENHELDPARWSLLATDDDGVREMAAVLGVRYRPEAGGEMAHSSIIFLIDAEGVIRHRQEGLNQGPDALLAAYRALP